MRLLPVLLATLLAAGCASFDGRGLLPGRDGLADVKRVMGEPAMQWQATDGALQLAYPRGPMAPESYMVDIGSDGKLKAIRNVLGPENFARIKPGMSKADVLRILGPAGTSDRFPARGELVLDWGWQELGEPAHFLVLFDARSETVRQTMIQVDRPPSTP